MSKIKSRLKNKWDMNKLDSFDTDDTILTKPNQAMSIKDILYRNTTGMAYDNTKTPYYEDEAQFSSEPINKINDMEPVEKLQYLSSIQAKVSTLKKKIKDDEDAKAEAIAKAQAEIEKQGTINEQTDSE